MSSGVLSNVMYPVKGIKYGTSNSGVFSVMFSNKMLSVALRVVMLFIFVSKKRPSWHCLAVHRVRCHATSQVVLEYACV